MTEPAEFPGFPVSFPLRSDLQTRLVEARPIETGKGLVTMWVGTLLFYCGLTLPLFSARYAPPGGYQVLAGHRVSAFTLAVTGRQFADVAPYSRLNELNWLLGGGAAMRSALAITDAQGWKLPGLKVSHSISKAIHGFVAGVVALGFVLLIGLLALLSGSPVVHTSLPLTGASGVLPGFEHPFSPGPSVETPWFTVTPGIGILVLALGIVLALSSLGKYAPLAIGCYIASSLLLTIVHHAFHQPEIDAACSWLQHHLLIT